MKRSYLLAVVLLALVACSDDPGRPTIDDPKTSYLAPTSPGNVLRNLELAFNQRNIDELDNVLDDAFVFFFADEDINTRTPTPADWGRDMEMAVIARLFDDAHPGNTQVTAIALTFHHDGLTWVDYTDPGFPGETWRALTMVYEFEVDAAPDWKFITAPGTRAEVMCREFEVPDNAGGTKKEWRLVRLRDLGSSG